ncbi:MAG: hypothetical protein LBH43_05985 [Treponema sp.]|jgi:hypothetical protein|nr:hypothetical protein [Treponema sp.]
MSGVAKWFFLVVFLLSAIISVFSQEIDKKFFGVSVSNYPDFDFSQPSSTKLMPEQCLTDYGTEYNMAFSVEMGLRFWKDFRFLFNFAFDGDSIEDNPVGFLTNLSASLGYKNLMFSYRMHNIRGSFVWNFSDVFYPELTGPLGERTKFSISQTMMELSVNILAPLKYIVRTAAAYRDYGNSTMDIVLQKVFSEETLDLFGTYLGLVYFTYDGLGAIACGPLCFYDGYYSFKGLGFSLDADTYSRLLLYEGELPKFYKYGRNLCGAPWVKLKMGYVYGLETQYSGEAEKRIKEHPSVPEDWSLSDFHGNFFMEAVLGWGFLLKTNSMDIGLGAGGQMYMAQYDVIGNISTGYVIKASIRF